MAVSDGGDTRIRQFLRQERRYLGTAIAHARREGADRLQVIRQLLTESLLLACVGGGFGLLLAFWSVHAIAASSPANLPRVEEIGLDTRVVLFTFCVSVVTGFLFGAAPALKVAKS